MDDAKDIFLENKDSPNLKVVSDRIVQKFWKNNKKQPENNKTTTNSRQIHLD